MAPEERPKPDDRGGGAKVRFHPARASTGFLQPLHAERLYDLLGVEKELNEAARILRHYAQSEKPPVIGAMHITCSDEAERECVEAFQRNFVRYLLPSLKFSSKAAFRTSNLGGRYEWGSVRIAEDHFALAKGAAEWKLLVVKINAHVSVEPSPEGARFGRMGRYKTESVYCGAIDAVLSGADAPFADELGAAYGFEGFDRLATLRDAKRVDPTLKNLYGAVVGARVQARRAMLDVQDYEPCSPTLYMILPCVTLNRKGHDTEILCGIYTADHRVSGEPHYEYCGLGDRPERYVLGNEASVLTIKDPEIHIPRNARDHRSLVLEEWRRQGGDKPPTDERLLRAVRDATADRKHHHSAHSKLVLKALLAVVGQIAPIPAAILLFGEGLVNIHHTAKAHQLAREAQGDGVARELLGDIAQRVDTLDPDQAKHLVELLLNEYGG